MEIPQAETILRRLGLVPGPGPARLKPRLPMTAVQITSERVAAVRLVPPASRKGADRRPVLVAFRESDVPVGAVDPSLTRPNIPDPTSVGQTVGGVLAQVAPRESRICVVVPDSIARVSILKFNRMPSTRREVLDLVRFRLQKVLPFRIEEAALDYHLLSDPSSVEPEFLVALVQRPILWQYERLFTTQDRIPGLVDLASFNVLNLVRSTRDRSLIDTGDQALVNAAEGYMTVLLFRDGSLNFYRSKPFATEERSHPERFHSAIRRELASCFAFYREHLAGAGLLQATIRVGSGDPRAVLEETQVELGCPARLVDPGRAVVLPAGAAPEDPFWQRLAPALGAALGRRS